VPCCDRKIEAVKAEIEKVREIKKQLGQRPNSSDADAEVSTRNDGQEAP
jgi:hypothetical protein